MIKAENVSVKYLMTYDRIQSMKEYLEIGRAHV